MDPVFPKTPSLNIHTYLSFLHPKHDKITLKLDNFIIPGDSNELLFVILTVKYDVIFMFLRMSAKNVIMKKNKK